LSIPLFIAEVDIYVLPIMGPALPLNDTCPLVPCMTGALPEWHFYFKDLAVGETAAPGCFSRDSAEGGQACHHC
jgi:hypothetical protein